MPVWNDMGMATHDLRVFLSDQENDKPVKSKAVVGRVDGVNRAFHTWDDRLVVGTLAVTVNDSVVPITLADPMMGRFEFATAPAVDPPPVIRAQYYYQYFTDEEIETALEQGSSQMDANGDPTLVVPGLQLACLHFAGFLLYEKMAMRWVERMTSRFLMEEAPVQGEDLGRSNLFRDMARDLRNEARNLRTHFYQGQGRRSKPAFSVYYPQGTGRGWIGPRT